MWKFVDRWVEIPPLAFPKLVKQDLSSIPFDGEVVRLLDLRAKLYVDGYKVIKLLPV